MSLNQLSRRPSVRQRNLYGQAFGLSLLAMVVPAVALAQRPAPTLPTGGVVTSGAATIKSSATGVTIKQSSTKAIINWTDFSIGQGDTVNFSNAGGATLNRVSGANVSAIDGTLTSNGSVYLINPNGVVIGSTGKVQTTGSFVASTLDLSDANFQNGGDLNFTQANAGGGDAVINYGAVGSSGGDVVMIASNVTNTGKITAPNGTAGLLSGASVLLRDQATANGKFAIADVNPGSVTNGGAINAANAELRAAGGNVYAMAGSTAGTIKATAVTSSDGQIWLTSNEGVVNVAGMITAIGAAGVQGQIVTAGADVSFDPSTKVTAGGDGRWAIARTNTGFVNATEASAVSYSLNHGVDVGEQSPNGVIIEAPISFKTGNSLYLSNAGGLFIDAKISVLGAGNIVIKGADLSANPSSVQFNGGSIDYGSVDHGGTLTINDNAYRLLYSLDAIDAIDGVSGETGASVTAPGGGLGGYYALATSVSGSGRTFTHALVGDDNNEFTGQFEGLGNTISNLTVNSTDSDVGLFSQSTGVIRDLSLTNNVTTGADNVGGLAGINTGTMANIYVSTTVSQAGNAYGYVGGIVGENLGSIINAVALGSATSTQGAAGGIAGYSAGAINNSATNATVTGDDAGGLVGENENGIILNSNTTGAVTGTTYAGGVVGYTSQGSLSNVIGTSSVSTTSGYAGGVAGYADGSITYAHFSGAVSGGQGSNVGGVVGYSNGTIINNVSATGSVTGDAVSAVGGIAGYASGGSITYATSFATVRGGALSSVGGIVGNGSNLTVAQSGQLSGSISAADASSVGGVIGSASNAYLTGNVSAAPLVSGGNSSVVGGIVGTLATSQLMDSANSGDVSGGDGSSVGGVVGSAVGGSTIDHSHADNFRVTGGAGANTLVGGLIGSAGANTVVTYDAVYSETVTGGKSAAVGGLIGSATSSTVQHVFAASSATGGDASFVGGLIGNASDTKVDDAYVAAAVSGGHKASVGAIIGKARTGSLSNSSYDTDVSGALPAIGVLGPKPPTQSNVVGLDSADFYNQPSLSEFRFDPYVPQPM